MLYDGSMELSYVAGLFDGEGNVSVTKPPRCRVVAQVAMTHRPTIDALHAQFGGRVQRIDQAKYNPNARDRFDWRLTDTPALEFLRAIRPWLITKASVVDRVLEYPMGARGRKVSPEVRAGRIETRNAVMEANRRGR